MIAPTPGQLDAVKYDEHGLVPAIAQDLDGTVLMLAWMTPETLCLTMEVRVPLTPSRSRW